jgi:hypothetical protein
MGSQYRIGAQPSVHLNPRFRYRAMGQERLSRITDSVIAILPKRLLKRL